MATSTPTRSSPTTSRTPQLQSRTLGPSSTTEREGGDEEARIACAFVADVIHDVATRLIGREQEWGAEPGALDSALSFARPYRSPEFLSELCGTQGPRHLDDFVMVQDTFRRFAEERIRPIAEEIHRNNEDIPEEIIEGLSEIGTFGVSIPEEYEGFVAEGEGEYLSMVAATEELSRGSLGVGGSADHPTRDPGAGAFDRRHRGAEAGVAAAHGQRRADGRDRRDGAPTTAPTSPR